MLEQSLTSFMNNIQMKQNLCSINKKRFWVLKWKMTPNAPVDEIFSGSSSDAYFLSALWIPGWSSEIVCEQNRSAACRHSPIKAPPAKLFELFDDTNASPRNYPLEPLSKKVSAIFSPSAWEKVSAKNIMV